jgi:hypothetical protein
MRILTNGNVGIGTTTPATNIKLDVVGNVGISQNSYYGIGNGTSTDRVLSNPGTNNIFLGVNAYNTSFTGSRATHLGVGTGGAATSADDNTLVGFETGARISSGDRNTVVGSLAGATLTTAESTTLLGYNAQANPTAQNATAIGANTTANCNNCLILGHQANVGIATENPTERLEVNGNIMANALILKATDGDFFLR